MTGVQTCALPILVVVALEFLVKEVVALELTLEVVVLVALMVVLGLMNLMVEMVELMVAVVERLMVALVELVALVMVPLLIGLGVAELSVVPALVAPVKYLIRRLKLSEAQELAALERLAEEGAGYAADWIYGETLIRDSYFVEYVREMLEDCNDIPRNLPHYVHIDWERTARDVQMDYTAVEFDGVTYWIR